MRCARFTFRLWPTLAAVTGVGILASLGAWQTHRGYEKRAQFEAFARAEGPTMPYGAEGGQARYAHVRLEGRYDPLHQVLLDNMTHDGRVGYRVLTPLRTSLGLVLVDRGWMAAPARREELPDLPVTAEVRVVTGRIDDLPRAGIELKTSDGVGWPRRLSYPDLSALRRIYAAPVAPSIILLDAAAPDGFLRDWRPGGLPPERHFGYAVQWYGLSLALLVLFLVANFRKPDIPS